MIQGRLCFYAIPALLFLLVFSGAAGADVTNYPWPSHRHDLLNTGAAPDSGYPETLTIKWQTTREPELFFNQPAGARGATAVENGIVYTSGSGIIQANRQDNGTLIWSRWFPLERLTTEPAGAPTDWCYNDIPHAEGEGNTGVCYVADLADCPSWCFQCTDVQPDCSRFSLIEPLQLPVGYKQFVTSVTLDSSWGPNGALYFGTFDGRFIALDMADGSTIWERTPFKDPGGPNDGAPWYNQKFAWNLGVPTVYNGKIYFGAFMASFYAILRPWAYTSGPGYPWPNLENDATHYWAGRDGTVYALDQGDGSIVWTWDPRGCGVTNTIPVKNGKVFINADTVTDYHYGQFVAIDAETGDEVWHRGTIPLAQGGSMPISGDTIYFPGGDGALWALDVNTGQVKWGYHAGFCVMGHTAIENSPAVDEIHEWVIGVADTGKIFVLNKDTGRVVKEAFMGVPSWNVGDPHPVSGFWFPGPSGACIVPSQGLLYIAGTDYERAWQGQFNKGREKLFCYDYLSSPDTITLLWEKQMCLNDDCSQESNEFIVRGHDPYVISWYSMGTPALADGNVFYASENGYLYCFGD